MYTGHFPEFPARNRAVVLLCYIQMMVEGENPGGPQLSDWNTGEVFDMNLCVFQK